MEQGFPANLLRMLREGGKNNTTGSSMRTRWESIIFRKSMTSEEMPCKGKKDDAIHKTGTSGQNKQKKIFKLSLSRE